MSLRVVKLLLVMFVGLMCVFYGLQNLANLREAHGFMTAVLTNAGHEIYPSTFAFAINSSVIAWICLAVVIALELTAGIFALLGAWSLWVARKQSAAVFNAEKYLAYVGAGLALLVWFGLFTAIGGSFFQMWQTQLGAASLEGSFQYLGAIALVTLFVSIPDR